MNLFITPRTLKEGVMHSQLLSMVQNLNKIYSSNNYLLIHKSEPYIIQNEEFVKYYTSIMEVVFKYSNTIDKIYTRSVFDFIKVYFIKIIYLKKISIIFDFRGILSEESYLKNKSHIKRMILKQLESFVYKKADSIHTVSNSFKAYLNTVYTERDINVIPCSVSTAYEKKETNNDSIKFVYIGGLSDWQKVDEVLKIYLRITQEQNNTSLTFITSDKEKASRMLNEFKQLEVEVKTLSHKETIKDLKNYDFGFLLRDNILLNNVASPIKFLEYISQGVIPIITDGIGDYSEIVKKNKIGLIAKLNEEQSMIEDIVKFKTDSEVHDNLYNIAKDYTWQKTLLNFYK